MIQGIQSFLIFLIFVLLFCRYKYGLSVYLAYYMLVPYIKINWGGFTLQWNLINLLVLLAFFINYFKKHSFEELDWKPFIPFLLYFFFSLLFMLFQDSVPLSMEIDSWRMQFMKYIILPFAIWHQIKCEPSSLKIYRNTLFVCIGVAVFYGMFLTLTPGINPYIMLLQQANGIEYNEAYFLSEDSGRVFGRISSVFIHPMGFGLFLGLSALYVYNNRKELPKFFSIILQVLIVCNIIVCGVRTVILATVITLVYYLIRLRNLKIIISTLVLGFLVFYISSFVPGLSEYVRSIVEENSSTVRGSSLDMRLSQLQGCFDEIKNCFVFGKGWGWNVYYMELNGVHPVIYAFESLLFVVLCNSGLVGCVLWIVMIYKIIKFNNKQELKFAILLDSMLVFYITYSFITGEYGYMQTFIIFYILSFPYNFKIK